MKSLSPAEIKKYQYRRDLLVQKLNDRSPFALLDGTDIVFQSNNFEHVNGELRDLRLYDADNNEFRLTQLAKTSEFGGKSDNGTKRENAALVSLNKQIDAAKWESGYHNVLPIMIGNELFYVDRAESTPGTPKSDIHLIDYTEGECAWISHKHGSSPTHFQQWGGVSPVSDRYTHTHYEVEAFVEKIKSLYPNGLEPKTTLFRPLEAMMIQNIAVYGKDHYSAGPGRNNVSMVLQGDINLVKHQSVDPEESFWTIEGSSHTHRNGEMMVDGYEPALYAVYKSDRSDMGIKNCRITINPMGSRNKRTLV